MDSDVRSINSAAAQFLAELNNKRTSGLVLCKCDCCEKPGLDVPVWERTNFVARSTASLHVRTERLAKKQPPAKKGRQQDQSFWTPLEVVEVFRQEALLALQEGITAGFSDP